MDSIAEASRDAVYQTKTDRLEAIAGEAGDVDVVIHKAGLWNSDVVEQAVETEDIAERQEGSLRMPGLAARPIPLSEYLELKPRTVQVATSMPRRQWMVDGRYMSKMQFAFQDNAHRVNPIGSLGRSW